MLNKSVLNSPSPFFRLNHSPFSKISISRLFILIGLKVAYHSEGSAPLDLPISAILSHNSGLTFDLCLYFAKVTNNELRFVINLAQPIYFSNSSGVFRSNSFFPSLNLLNAEYSHFEFVENHKPGFFTLSIFSVWDVRTFPTLKISIKWDNEV